ncbi:type II toxin-antitoxin system VapC family toxin [Methylovulum psychrotolerans]|uniref:Ribonuclease VapC11 n=1 Tax=Methylovulum psychrotolerans TaxID=1704499 RepID=A0A2S5CST1_9GAMM|nr:PIN domain-containing protein [Methylovulum psychrotolerans]POZ53864.1 Ribonuclease VapC11 [Methylovulum psychrotolerans]
MVLVDTPIWSYAFRSNNADFENYIESFKRLIIERRVALIGAIRQEILSGYSDLNKFEALKNKLSGFENVRVIDADYIQAAMFANICRKNGVQGSSVDFLICAVAVRLQMQIYTTDKDFYNYQKHLPIKLYKLIVN